MTTHSPDCSPIVGVSSDVVGGCDTATSLPDSLRCSITTQTVVLGSMSISSLLIGMSYVSLLCLVGILAVRQLYRTLATGLPCVWLSSLAWTVVSVAVFVVLTGITAVQSPIHGLFGVVICGLQIQFFAALTSRPVRRFFAPQLSQRSDQDSDAGIDNEPNQLTGDGPLVTNRQRSQKTLLSVTGLLIALSAPSNAESLRDVIPQLPDSYRSRASKLTAQLDAFDRDVEQEQNRFLARLKLEHRNATTQFAREGVEAANDWIILGGELPTNEVAERLAYAYIEKIAARQDKVWPLVENMANNLRRDFHTDLADAMVAAYGQMTGSINAHSVLRLKANYGGIRIKPDGLAEVTMRIRIDKIVGLNFEAFYERDMRYRGNPAHQMSGSVRGCRFQARVGKAFTDRKDKDWEFVGYVVGKTILGRYQGRGLKNANEGGLFRLRLTN